MKRFVTPGVAVLLSVVVIGCSGSAPSAPSAFGGATPQGRILLFDPGPYTSGDLNFITVASRMHQAFIMIADVGEERSAYPGVKQFAQQMLQENQERLDLLRASTVNAVPQTITIDPAHQQLVTDLRNVSGNEADRVYTQGMLPALEALLALYQQEASSGSSSVLRQIAADFVPRIENYLETLRELTARVR